MEKTPKSMRLHIALFGRTNVGKSSFLNMVSGQDIAITSPVPGTTTDVVEKPMELLPIGPVVFLDTAGLDDTTELGEKRMKKTNEVFRRAEIVVILCENGNWSDPEKHIMQQAADNKLPVIAVVNKIDEHPAAPAFIEQLKAEGVKDVLTVSSVDKSMRERCISDFKQALISVCPDDFVQPPPLVGDLIRPGGIAVLIVPIDLQAPKGRLILPQVQTIRDALDNDASVIVVKERGISPFARTAQESAGPRSLRFPGGNENGCRHAEISSVYNLFHPVFAPERRHASHGARYCRNRPYRTRRQSSDFRSLYAPRCRR